MRRSLCTVLRQTCGGGRRRPEDGFQLCRAAPRTRVVAVVAGQLRELDEGELNQQALVAAGAVVEVAVVAKADSPVEEFLRTFLRLCLIAPPHLVADVEQRQGDGIAAHQQVAQVRRQTADEVAAVESALEYLVEQQDAVGRLVLEKEVGEAEEIVVVEDVEVVDDVLVGDVAVGVADHLVEDREGVAHAAVGLLGNHHQRLFLRLDVLLGSHAPEVLHDVADADAVEVVHLAAAQDGGQHLMALGGGEDELGVGGRLLERLQKGVEGGGREHVHLVDDEHLVPSHLRRYAHLVDEAADVLHRVVAGGIQLVDVERAALVEGTARLALVASLALGRQVLAVDGLGKDACARGLSHATRTAEQVCMRQLVLADGVLQRGGQSLLANHRVERRRTVFPG